MSDRSSNERAHALDYLARIVERDGGFPGLDTVEIVKALREGAEEIRRLEREAASQAEFIAACIGEDPAISVIQTQRDQLRAALERIAEPTAEGHWRTRPGAADFISLAQAVLATVGPLT